MRLLLAATLALIVAPAALHARDSADCRIGNIRQVYGEVSVIRDGATQVPEAGEAFCRRDRFVTGPRGVAQLQFRDGTEITVGKDTEFAIDHWKKRRLFANEAGFTLVRGAFRALTGAITERRHRFEVTTPIATIGVRGTEFWGGTNLGDNALDVIMLKGKGVYVTNAAGTVELDTAGQGTTVEAGRAPGSATPWSAAKVQRAVQTITP